MTMIVVISIQWWQWRRANLGGGLEEEGAQSVVGGEGREIQTIMMIIWCKNDIREKGDCADREMKTEKFTLS
jgi:hypothetical protein